ncbi:MAG: type II 3-dehydroquinate dehydratase [Candidatus Velthaea sp.]
MSTAPAPHIVVLNGPNLNLLGTREPQIYGTLTLAALEDRVVTYGRERGVHVRCEQHNGEGQLIDALHRLVDWADGIVLNPAAYTHYSIAIRDAIAAIPTPVVEVHLTRLADRALSEPFRAISVTAERCIAQIDGLGVDSYLRGLDALLAHFAARAER